MNHGVSAEDGAGPGVASGMAEGLGAATVPEGVDGAGEPPGRACPEAVGAGVDGSDGGDVVLGAEGRALVETAGVGTTAITVDAAGRAGRTSR